MTDKEKIRKKVVEIVNSINQFIPDEDGKNSDYEAGKFDMALKILQVIDSLQEEPAEVYKPKFCEGDIIQRKDGDSRKYQVIEIDVELGVYGLASCDENSSYSLDFENQEQWELVEEPVSEDLGEYINEISKQFPEVSFAKLSRIAVRVAEWQRRKMLNEAMEGVKKLKED